MTAKNKKKSVLAPLVELYTREEVAAVLAKMAAWKANGTIDWLVFGRSIVMWHPTRDWATIVELRPTPGEPFRGHEGWIENRRELGAESGTGTYYVVRGLTGLARAWPGCPDTDAGDRQAYLNLCHAEEYRFRHDQYWRWGLKRGGRPKPGTPAWERLAQEVIERATAEAVERYHIEKERLERWEARHARLARAPVVPAGEGS